MHLSILEKLPIVGDQIIEGKPNAALFRLLCVYDIAFRLSS